MFNLFPYLKGWEYKSHEIVRNDVIRGAPPIEKRISESGWLLGVDLFSSDCYGTFSISWQGAELETNTTTGNAEVFRSIGKVSQDPSGWSQRYFRPNPNSSAGIFFTVFFTGGFQGTTFPYVPTVVMNIVLPSDSTQESAYIRGIAVTIAITNKPLWLKSLRSILGVKGKIDPALLQLGAGPMMEDIVS